MQAYPVAQRGEQSNLDLAAMKRDYTQLRWRNITPTDMDGYVEFGGELFVFFDLKSKGATILYGQELSFTRLVDSLKTRAVFIVADHDTPFGEEILADKAVVTRWYERGQWHTPSTTTTLLEFIDGIVPVHFCMSR